MRALGRESCGRGLRLRSRTPSPGHPGAEPASSSSRAGGAKAEGGETRGQCEEEDDVDADQEGQAEAADHGGWGELEGEEAGGGCEAGGGDRGAAFGCSCAGRVGTGESVCRRFVEAGLELDRVVDGEADQDRED